MTASGPPSDIARMDLYIAPVSPSLLRNYHITARTEAGRDPPHSRPKSSISADADRLVEQRGRVAVVRHVEAVDGGARRQQGIDVETGHRPCRARAPSCPANLKDRHAGFRPDSRAPPAWRRSRPRELVLISAGSARTGAAPPLRRLQSPSRRRRTAASRQSATPGKPMAAPTCRAPPAGRRNRRRKRGLSCQPLHPAGHAQHVVVDDRAALRESSGGPTERLTDLELPQHLMEAMAFHWRGSPAAASRPTARADTRPASARREGLRQRAKESPRISTGVSPGGLNKAARRGSRARRSCTRHRRSRARS